LDTRRRLEFGEWSLLRQRKSVYFSYPRSGYQVEVYDPSPQQARTLVLGGKITPIK
jgi:hypothetical protein